MKKLFPLFSLVFLLSSATSLMAANTPLQSSCTKEEDISIRKITLHLTTTSDEISSEPIQLALGEKLYLFVDVTTYYEGIAFKTTCLFYKNASSDKTVVSGEEDRLGWPDYITNYYSFICPTRKGPIIFEAKGVGQTTLSSAANFEECSNFGGKPMYDFQDVTVHIPVEVVESR